MKSLTGKVILVVDDEDLLREILRDVFESQGAHVLDASDGNSAFEVLRDRRVDLVLTDVRMPGGDGLELVRRIRAELGYQPKVFLCTGLTEMSAEDAEKLGVHKVIKKPYELSRVIKEMVAALVAEPPKAA